MATELTTFSHPSPTQRFDRSPSAHRSRLALSATLLLGQGCSTASSPGVTPTSASTEPVASVVGAASARCELEVKTSATLVAQGTYEVSTLLTNKTDRQLDKNWVIACPGPAVTYHGLPAGYDLGATCQAGNCPGGEVERRSVALPPGASAVVDRTTILSSGDGCNAALPPGEYRIAAHFEPEDGSWCTRGVAAITIAMPADDSPAPPLDPAPAPVAPPPAAPGPGQEPCPAMACAYEPCPPGVSPPTGCTAVCGCAGHRGRFAVPAPTTQ